MAEPVKNVDAVSSGEESHVDIPKKVTIASENQDQVKNIGKPKGPVRNSSVYSTSGRRLSEWEALQIVAAGDTETIEREIAEVENDLQAMNIQSTWYKPQIHLKDARYFTWLLVGKYYLVPGKINKISNIIAGFASMGGLLSGVDQSLISGANLFMPKG